MRTTRYFSSDPISVVAYECDAGPHTPAFVERHGEFSLSFVSAGTFGYIVEGQLFDLVPGSVLVGRPGVEYVCTHEHSCGDVCLSFRISQEFAESTGLARTGRLPPCLAPHPELMILGELAQGAAAGRNDLGADEAALLFVTGVARTAGAQQTPRRSWSSAAARRKAIDAADRIDAHAADPLTLDRLARDARLSIYHFLRVFSDIVGVTPHQYLVRARLRLAARLLEDDERQITGVALESGFGDLSNFVRTFHRAAGVSPRRYRRAAHGDRKILQDRFARRRVR